MPTPNQKFKFKDQAQARVMALGAPAEGARRFDVENYVEGYAARYEPYLLYDDGDYGRVYERFAPGCFDNCDMTDVILQYDHAGRVFARTTNGTLVVEPDENGLFMAADLSRTEKARDLYADIAAGMITKMSWRFKVGKYYIERQEGSKDQTIVHTEIPKIYDVSAVSIPANDATEINARGWADGVIGEAVRSETELEERRRKLKLKINIMEELSNAHH